MDTLAPTSRSRVRRLPARASYDRAALDAVLDTGLVCHVAFAVDGQPHITATSYWREGDHVYWHGSPASRMIRHLTAGAPCAFSVTHLDGLVLARSGFHHSLNYRSVVLYGIPEAVADRAEKKKHLDAFIDRIAPGRNAALRPVTPRELRATAVLRMAIAEGAAKTRTGPPIDDDADYGLPVWAGVVPITMRAGAPISDREPPGTLAVPAERGGFRHLGVD